MKRQLICFISLLVLSNECFAQQTDPTLTAAVGAQSAMLNNLFSKREKTQKKIIAAETAVTVAMDRMHKVEDQMLEYLSNAQGAMQNLYQIKRAAELVTTEIPQNMNLVKKSLPGHLKGTAIAILYPFMKQLVTSGSYNVSDYDEKGNPVNKKHKVNLLNSAERYYVANEVVTKLESINTDLWLLAWQIRTYSWNDLWYGLDPVGWASVMSGKAIVEGLIYDWQYL